MGVAVSTAHFVAGAVAGALVGVLAARASDATTEAPRGRRLSEAETARAARAVDAVFVAAAAGEGVGVVARRAREAMAAARGVPGLRWRSAEELTGAAMSYAAKRAKARRQTQRGF